MGSNAMTDIEQHHTRQVVEFGDETHVFAITMGGIRELQNKCKCGINDLYVRLTEGHWYADDLREIIRVGLVDGGMKPVDALRLVERYVDNRPLIESYGLAARILLSALITPQDAADDASQKKSEEEQARELLDLISGSSTGTVQ